MVIWRFVDLLFAFSLFLAPSSLCSQTNAAYLVQSFSFDLYKQKRVPLLFSKAQNIVKQFLMFWNSLAYAVERVTEREEYYQHSNEHR